ncbi:MAG: hydrolase [Clostridiales bacterium]|uniref:hydrolase n=1 Tax=Terrisporobacter sp. TaxID=1965305 RepID=UPI002A387DE6|nr:hydrolase [Terrisporobacter sp.]MCI5628699.1 hydrolase [Clostridium sp.]MDD5878541.1 hydrolase [Clostridiales bacterium]MCI6456351.1 hydrolase [Clostridium sp.]MCI7207361.1 hydrolase [Clostridium sp.]MDD7754814.1 hydrolase [Clostridiales bacterium]
MKEMPTAVHGTLRKSFLRVPEVIRQCSGINVFGKRIKSLAYTTDLAIIRNINADAIWAVYPFTPQPIITQSLLLAADIPVFTGVGGGLTSGLRSVMLGTNAEIQGAMGVIVNAPTPNETVKSLADALDIPVIVSVISEDTDIEGRIKAGASILNVSASTKTPMIVAKIRKDYPKFPIIATGGHTDETILETIAAGANAITWSPPTVQSLFKKVMNSYRNNSDYYQ